MPRKRKGTVARQNNAKTALKARVSKRQRSHSELGAGGNTEEHHDEIPSDDENVCSSKLSLINKCDFFQIPENFDIENPGQDLENPPEPFSIQSTFHVQIDKNILAPVPQTEFFHEWSIIIDPTEIDGPEEVEEETDPSLTKSVTVAEHPNDLDSESSDDEEDDTLEKEDIREHGQELENGNTGSGSRSLQPASLKGYEHSKFEPKPYSRDLPGEARLHPTQDDALKALQDLMKILRPNRNTMCHSVAVFSHRSGFFSF